MQVELVFCLCFAFILAFFALIIETYMLFFIFLLFYFCEEHIQKKYSLGWVIVFLTRIIFEFPSSSSTY